jgi:uncharacterized membrane protein YccC
MLREVYLKKLSSGILSFVIPYDKSRQLFLSLGSKVMSEYLPESNVQAGPPSRQRRKMKIDSWFTTLKSSWKMVSRIDRSSITAFQAIRSTFGMGLPLVLGVVTNSISTGVVIASGALMLGSVGLKDTSQSRWQTMLLACLFIALAALIGGLIGGLGWLPVLVIGIWGLVAGMFVSFSPVAQIVGVQSCVALIVYAHLDLDPPHAVLIAALVCVGALFQVFLAIVPSPWKNTVPERSALASIYQKLAAYTIQSSDEQGVLQISEALQAAHTMLLHSNTRNEKGQMLARLLEEAEHLRLTLFVLIGQRQSPANRESDLNENKTLATLDQLIQLSSDELEAIAQALKPSGRIAEAGEQGSLEKMKKALAELRCIAEHNAEFMQILPYCTALLGQLHIARRLATSLRYARRYWPARIRFPYPRPPRLHLENIASNIRANLTLRSSAFRHALRLGVTLALATALYQIFHIPVERGYWIPMTAALVLRSDFITTFARGIARLLGTLLGAVLATLLAILLARSPLLLLIVVISAAYAMYATLFANYTLFSVATTMAVVFLLAFTHVPTLETAAFRALDTVIGGTLALLVYTLWPTWEQSQVPENIAQRIEMLAKYLNAVMQVYADPDASQRDALEKQHMQSRMARLNALGSLQRSLQEPEPHRANAELAEGILGASDNISRSVLALEAYLLDHPHHSTLPEVTLFSGSTDAALGQLATALRTNSPASALPDVSQAARKLKATVKARWPSPAKERDQWNFVAEEAKRIAVNIQAMQQLLAHSSFAPMPRVARSLS